MNLAEKDLDRVYTDVVLQILTENGDRIDREMVEHQHLIRAVLETRKADWLLPLPLQCVAHIQQYFSWQKCDK